MNSGKPQVTCDMGTDLMDSPSQGSKSFFRGSDFENCVVVVEHQKREAHLVKFSLDGKITVLKSSPVLVVGRGMGTLFGQEESFLLPQNLMN